MINRVTRPVFVSGIPGPLLKAAFMPVAKKAARMKSIPSTIMITFVTVVIDLTPLDTLLPRN